MILQKIIHLYKTGEDLRINVLNRTCNLKKNNSQNSGIHKPDSQIREILFNGSETKSFLPKIGIQNLSEFKFLSLNMAIAELNPFFCENHKKQGGGKMAGTTNKVKKNNK